MRRTTAWIAACCLALSISVSHAADPADRETAPRPPADEAAVCLAEAAAQPGIVGLGQALRCWVLETVRPAGDPDDYSG